MAGEMMGWSYGTNAAGRAVGYAVEATCDALNCNEKIDRGLSYVCGGMHDGDEYGCGGYFCARHLFYCHLPSEHGDPDENGVRSGFVQLCRSCSSHVKDLDDGEEEAA